MLLPSTSAMFQKAGMLAADGRCKTLDSSADGYVRSEYCGLISLAPFTHFDQAGTHFDQGSHGDRGADGHPLGILAGTAVNQDGRSSSLTAPSGPAQQAVIAAALTAGAVGAPGVGSIQLHGTGTSLGDPVEIDAVSTALSIAHRGSASGVEPTWHGGQPTYNGVQPTRVGVQPTSSPLSLQAGKSRMGHAEPAAGIAGLLGAVDTIGIAQLQPILHLRSVNPHVAAALQQQPDHSTSGVMVSRQHAPAVATAGDALAGCSAFAFQVRPLKWLCYFKFSLTQLLKSSSVPVCKLDVSLQVARRSSMVLVTYLGQHRKSHGSSYVHIFP